MRVDLIITNQSRNSERIANNIKALNIFENVFWVDTKELCKSDRNIRKVLSRIKCIIWGIRNNKIADCCQYDELFFYNTDVFTHGVFAFLNKENPNLVCNRFEEGILSYCDSVFLEKSRLKVANYIRQAMNKELLEDKTNVFYCFYPELYNGTLKVRQIPKIQNNNMRCKLQRIFGIDDNKINYEQKYIFFTSVYDFEGGEPIGEYELVCRIADLVGKENLLIKMHPRDSRTIYTDNGFAVDKNSAIPWEAIQLSGDFSDTVFMTVNSGSVLAGSFMSKKPVKTFYMYKLCDISKNDACMKSVKDIEMLLKDKKTPKVLSNVHIAESLNDIL